MRVHIEMPDEMYADLQERAASMGITVTEYMRRAVSLYRLIYEHDGGDNG